MSISFLLYQLFTLSPVLSPNYADFGTPIPVGTRQHLDSVFFHYENRLYLRQSLLTVSVLLPLLPVATVVLIRSIFLFL